MAHIAIITAAGKGSRLLGDIPKQFILINNIPIYIHTLKIFVEHPKIDTIILLIPKGYDIKEELEKYFPNNNIIILVGGNTAEETRWIALNYLRGVCNDSDFIIFHDAVRPGLPISVLNNILECEGATTTFVYNKDCLLDLINNKPIYHNSPIRLQTPQMFLYKDIWHAYKFSIWKGCPVFTYLNCFHNLEYCYGDEKNFKITTIDDLKLCQNLF